MSLFVEISFIILIACGFSILMRFLKQPFVVGYILAGILVGPYFLNILHSYENIELFSKIGVTILLFIVGLNLNPKVIHEVGKISLITGLGQVIFTSIIGYLISYALGFGVIPSLYIAIALTFSSTIIILKLLGDKGDLNSLYGKISIGFLLVQDLIATLILIGITTLSGHGVLSLPLTIVILIAKAILVGAVLFIFSNYIIPRITIFLASSQELIFIFSLAWGMGIASLFSALGFSIEIGALIAGVFLSTSTFAQEIGSRMKPLRDFFILLFFILLGSQIAIGTISVVILPAVALSLFVLVGNPLIVIVLMNLLGYKRRTGFLAGLTVAQISEFSLILASLGVALGHLSNEVLSLITLVGLITISASTYLIIFSEKIYPRVEKFLKFFELRKNNKEKGINHDEESKIILFGYDRVGYDFVKAIKRFSKNFVVVDFNPESIKRLERENIPYKYGDAGDVEFLEEFNLSNISMAISTIPDFDTNLVIVHEIRKYNKEAIIIALSHNTKEAKTLYDKGASYVVMPHHLGALFASSLIEKHGIDSGKFEKEKQRHIKHISKREKRLHLA